MTRSILSNERKCYRCGTTQNLHVHHIYAGSLRKASDQAGCWVYLCMNHHTGAHGVHNTKEGIAYWKKLQAKCQEAYEELHGHDEFMKRFHRNFK